MQIVLGVKISARLNTSGNKTLLVLYNLIYDHIFANTETQYCLKFLAILLPNAQPYYFLKQLRNLPNLE